MKHININIDKEAVKNTVKTGMEYTLCVAVGVLGFFGTVIAASMEPEMDRNVSYRTNRTIGYSDAIDSIVGSSMFDSSKTKTIDILKRDMDEDYYKAVINIVKSDMFDSNKVSAIKRISN